MKVKRGDVWLVNLDPTIGHEIRKTRPAVVVQNDIGNEYSSTTIIAPITSQNTEKIYPMEVLLESKESMSKVLLNQIRAVDKQRLLKHIGSVDSETMHRVNEALMVSLGL